MESYQTNKHDPGQDLEVPKGHEKIEIEKKEPPPRAFRATHSSQRDTSLDQQGWITEAIQRGSQVEPMVRTRIHRGLCLVSSLREDDSWSPGILVLGTCRKQRMLPSNGSWGKVNFAGCGNKD